jgi:hypothetical protein
MNNFSKFELKQLVENGVVTVVFQKLDGTERTMNCTLLSEYLPAYAQPQLLVEEDKNPDTLSVWDVDAKGWRAFKVSNVKSASVKV